MRHSFKILIFFVMCSILNAQNEEQTTDDTPTQSLENLFEFCIASTNVERHIAHQARRHDLTFNDHRGNCFLKCICMNLGFCDAELKLVTRFLEENTEIDALKIRNSATKCSKITLKNECDTVFQRFKCFFKNVPETPVH